MIDTILERRHVLRVGLALGCAAAAPPDLPRVRIRSAEGDIVIEIDTLRAPVSAANFLRHVDLSLYDHGHFYRVVRPENDHSPATISVVQGGIDPATSPLPPIAHETDAATGLRNLAGTIAMARDGPGTATSEFFLNVTDNPALDFGGARGDGKGYAVFGRIVRGMDIVARIDRLKAEGAASISYTAGQILAAPIAFTIRRN